MGLLFRFSNFFSNVKLPVFVRFSRKFSKVALGGTSEHIDAEDWADVEFRDIGDSEGLADCGEAVPVWRAVEVHADAEGAGDCEPEDALDVEREVESVGHQAARALSEAEGGVAE